MLQFLQIFGIIAEYEFSAAGGKLYIGKKITKKEVTIWQIRF